MYTHDDIIQLRQPWGDVEAPVYIYSTVEIESDYSCVIFWTKIQKQVSFYQFHCKCPSVLKTNSLET